MKDFFAIIALAGCAALLWVMPLSWPLVIGVCIVLYHTDKK